MHHLRILTFTLLLATLGPLGTSSLWAQAASANLEEGFRGSGFYLDPGKIIATLVVYLLWISTTDWVSRDCSRYRQNYALWNSLILFTFLGGLLLMWLLPSFAIAFPILCVLYVAPLTTYIVLRNKQLEYHERVMTLSPIRYSIAKKLNAIGIPVKAEMDDPHAKGNAVKIKALAGETERDQGVHLLQARQLPGFPFLGDTIADSLDHSSDSVMLDVTAEKVEVHFQVDGVWQDGEALDRESGDNLIASIKVLCDLKPDERRAKQQGQFFAEYKGDKYDVKFVSSGTKTGERVVLLFNPRKFRFTTFEELGMRPKLVERMTEIVESRKGLILFSSPPRGGLTATIDATLHVADRFMRNFAAVEDDAHHTKEVQNVPPTFFNSAKGETPLTVLPKFLRTYPDVIVLRDLSDKETTDLLCDQIDENRLVISSIRAKEACEALLRVLVLGASREKFAAAITAVINQRLIRVLCEDCKEEYEPPPGTLKQLGIPPGKVEHLFRPPQEPEKACPTCGGIGYHGRTALFEILTVDDAVREILRKQPKLELLRPAARKAGMRSIKEEGILLVAKGMTSVPELVRILKG